MNHNSFLAIKSKVTVTIDERYQRTQQTILELKSSNLTSNVCLSAQVNISVILNIFLCQFYTNLWFI